MTCDTKKTQFDKFLSKIITVIESTGHNVIHISDIQNAKKITTDRCSKVLVYFSGKVVVQGSLEHRDSLKEALQSQNFNVA